MKNGRYIPRSSFFILHSSFFILHSSAGLTSRSRQRGERPYPVYCTPRPPAPQRPSIAAAGLAHVADHAVAAGGDERLTHLLRLLVARAGDDLALDHLPGRIPLAVAEGEHDERVLVGSV